MTREIELKLEIDPDDLPMVQRDLFPDTESRSNRQVTVYYDTPGTALKKHGFTLRVRSANGHFTQTVKPITDTVGLVTREEIECEVQSLEPELAALSAHPIGALVGKGKSNRLEPRIRSDVTRTSSQLERRSGIMQIDLDHGTIFAGARSQEFAELELELLSGEPASLVMAARRIAENFPVRIGVLTKAERGFLIEAGQLHRITKAAPVHVRPEMSVAEAFELIVNACIKQYRLNEPLVIGHRKSEALHQSRVAMRRLRSAFSLFKPAIEDVEFQHLRQELRWFTNQLGTARNLDVFLESDLEAEERALLIEKRRHAYADVVDAMNSRRFRRLLIDLVGWTAAGAWKSAKPGSRPIGPFAARRLDRLWRSITGTGRHIDRMEEHRRHELRIQVKKMRYAAEFLRELYPHSRDAEKIFGSAVESLQEALGKLNDFATARTLTVAPTEESWLIGSFDERRHLIDADDALRELKSVGRFWHMKAESA